MVFSYSRRPRFTGVVATYGGGAVRGDWEENTEAVTAAVCVTRGRGSSRWSSDVVDGVLDKGVGVLVEGSGDLGGGGGSGASGCDGPLRSGVGRGDPG